MGKDISPLEEVIGRLFRQKGWRLAVAESCTGGLISHRLTNISGSSDYFESSVVSYSNEAKMEILKVPADTINTHGAVSSQTAEAMAEGVRRLRKTEIGIGVTGIAGPTGGTAAKPVGLVYIALSSQSCVECREFRFRGEREEIKTKTSEAAFEMIREYLEKESK